MITKTTYHGDQDACWHAGMNTAQVENGLKVLDDKLTTIMQLLGIV